MAEKEKKKKKTIGLVSITSQLEMDLASVVIAEKERRRFKKKIGHSAHARLITCIYVIDRTLSISDPFFLLLLLFELFTLLLCAFNGHTAHPMRREIHRLAKRKECSIEAAISKSATNRTISKK